MTCADYEKWMSDLLDGVLSEKRQVLLDEHLASCPSCREYYERLQEIELRVKNLEAGPAAESPYWEKLSAAVRRRIAASSREKKGLWAWGWNWRWAWAAALVGVIVLGLILRPRPQPMPLADALRGEDILGNYDLEMATSPDLALALNGVLWNSFGKDLGLEDLAGSEGVFGDSLLEASLSDEEWEILDKEVRRQLSS